MRWKWTLLLVAPLALAILAVLPGLPRGGIPFRANRVLYLKNARRFTQALLEYERLQTLHPREAQRLPADFQRQLIESAAEYYGRQYVRRQEGAAYRAFLEVVGQHPELLPLARRKRLDFMVLLDSKSSETLHAARDILEHEGYDPEAFWWVARNQYDPTRPFTIPPELLKYRAAFARSLAASHEQPTPERATRLLFLNALLAIADRNWAEAAAALEQYRQGRSGFDALDLIHGLAYLKSGRPEAAIHHLLQYRQGRPGEPSTLRYLADAYLALGDYPWAAHAMHEIRACCPEQEFLVYLDAFGVSGDNPLDRICAFLRRGAPYAHDVALWAWLAEMAVTESQRRTIGAAAEELISADELSAPAQAALLQYCLAGRPDAARRLIAATSADVSTTAALRRQSMARLLEAHPRLLAAAAAEPPASGKPLLTREVTWHFRLALPRGATLCYFLVRGTPARGIWPIVHVSLGEYGARNFYLGNSATPARPFVLALPCPAADDGVVEGTVSLINGSEEGGAPRSVRILEMRAF